MYSDGMDDGKRRWWAKSRVAKALQGLEVGSTTIATVYFADILSQSRLAAHFDLEEHLSHLLSKSHHPARFDVGIV